MNSKGIGVDCIVPDLPSSSRCIAWLKMRCLEYMNYSFIYLTHALFCAIYYRSDDGLVAAASSTSLEIYQYCASGPDFSSRICPTLFASLEASSVRVCTTAKKNKGVTLTSSAGEFIHRWLTNPIGTASLGLYVVQISWSTPIGIRPSILAGKGLLLFSWLVLVLYSKMFPLPIVYCSSSKQRNLISINTKCTKREWRSCK
jgi:hypothetical protein